MIYQARTRDSSNKPTPLTQATKAEGKNAASVEVLGQLGQNILHTPMFSFVLISLIFMLLLLFMSSTYLVLKLDDIQSRMEVVNPLSPFTDWQGLLHTRSSKKFHEYLNTNLDQISQVRDSLEKLSNFLYTESNRKEESP